MLPFLRNLRRSLLASTGVRRYLLYATGEIALVVIGILIALQINNWNQERKDRNQEQILLVEINQEFQYNKKEFFENLDRYDSVRKNLSLIIEFFPIHLQIVGLDSLAKFLDHINFVGNYDKSTTTIAKLKNTSSLGILSNEKLRSMLLRWEVLAEDYAEMEVQALTYHEERFAPSIYTRFPRPFHKSFRDQRVDLQFLTTLEFESLIKRKRRKINNLFRSVQGNINIVTVMDGIIELSKKFI